MPGIEHPFRPLLNVVMLGQDAEWVDAVRNEADRIGLNELLVAQSPEEVVALLSGGFPAVTHLLLQPKAAGKMLPDLVDLTVGQSFGVVLVLLGEPALLDDTLVSDRKSVV